MELNGYITFWHTTDALCGLLLSRCSYHVTPPCWHLDDVNTFSRLNTELFHIVYQLQRS